MGNFVVNFLGVLLGDKKRVCDWNEVLVVSVEENLKLDLRDLLKINLRLQPVNLMFKESNN